MSKKKISETGSKIENAVVSGYKAIEDGVVAGYKKIEDKFVETFLSDKSKKEKHDSADTTSTEAGD
jgi:hypothetical protein